MKTLLCGAAVFTDGATRSVDIMVDGGSITGIGGTGEIKETAEKVIHPDNFFIIPALVDVHVHFREPGAEYKETIATGTAAAAAGGYSAVCPMPNLDPAPFNKENLDRELAAIKRDAKVRTVPYGRITDGARVADLESLAPYVSAFSDDGSGVRDAALMEEAMRRAKDPGRIIAAHCEDTDYAPEDPRSEYMQVGRDLELAAKTGCPYHVCHVSSRESVRLIREAKSSGVDVTCETAPHYLVFCSDDVRDDGRFRMNPPLRTAADREALLEAVADGTIDMIATDHAPHSAEEKSRGFAGSLNGVTGLESAFPVMYTSLVEGGVIPFGRLIRMMSGAPAERFGLPGGKIETGSAADLTVVDLSDSFLIDPSGWKSKGRSTPFAGMRVRGRIMRTIVEGKTVYER